MEEEIKNIIKVFLSVITSLTYCYYIPTKIPKGAFRFLSILPILILFTLLPLQLSLVHLTGNTGFFISWLGNFKLILFAFDQGPLSSHSSLSLLRFISFACLPIKTKIIPSPKVTKKISQIPLNFVVKNSLLAALFQIYYYKDIIYPILLLPLYCFQIYFTVEIILVIATTAAQTFLGLELEPPFDQPHLATSLQDLWGKRWNLMVTSILRPTVYYPVRKVLSRWIDRESALLLAVFVTFVVSGLMHELIFFYVCRMPPTWEVMWFFVLHGVCLVVEVLVKKKLNDEWWLPPMISTPLTIGFMVVTSSWLFFPQLLKARVDVKGEKEIRILAEFVKNVVQMSVDYVAKFFL